MSDPLPPEAPSPAPITPEAPGGFFQNLVDVYFSPREAFTRIVRSPRFLLPLAGYLLLVLGFTGIWMSKMEPREFMKMQLEESGRWDKIPAEQRDTVLDSAPTQIKIFGWLGPAVFVPLMLVVTAAALMFVFRFFYAGEVAFRQAFAIVTWVFFAVALVTTPLLLLILQLKGDCSSTSPRPPSRSGRSSPASTSSPCGWSSCSPSASRSPAARRRARPSGAWRSPGSSSSW
jgi:hypothetical protein